MYEGGNSEMPEMSVCMVRKPIYVMQLFSLSSKNEMQIKQI